MVMDIVVCPTISSSVLRTTLTLRKWIGVGKRVKDILGYPNISRDDRLTGIRGQWTFWDISRCPVGFLGRRMTHVEVEGYPNWPILDMIHAAWYLVGV